MHLAILSDLHADVHALRDALAQIDRLGCEHVVCAGDLVDYGLFPEETIGLLVERRIPCVRGNHDRWVMGRGRADAPEIEFDADTHDASGWDLTPEAMQFLARLPTAFDTVLEGVRVAVRHARPGSDMRGIDPQRTGPKRARSWLDEAHADVLVVGHTHDPFALEVPGGGLIVNPGALLREAYDNFEERPMLHDPETGASVPGPGPGRGTFGVLALPARRFTVHRASDGVEVEIPRIRLRSPTGAGG